MARMMYSIKCDSYEKEFNTIDELVQDLLNSGIDPNYEVTLDGACIGFFAGDYMYDSSF